MRALEARQIKLDSLVEEAGLKAFNGMINLSISFTGHGGDLILATGSVDQTGTYVFEVAPQVVGSILGKITGYWSVGKGNDAMYSLWNPSDAPQDVLATFYYGDGSGAYQVPVHLDPQASTMLDVAMLIMEKKPDPHGNVFPSNIQEGSASFASATNQGKVTVVVAGGLFNVSTATCGMICQYCNGYSNLFLSPGPFSGTIGSNWSLIAQATDSYGTRQTLNGGTWSSGTPSVMTVSNTGSAHAAAVGQASIFDFLQAVSVYQGQFCVGDNMNDACPTANETPQTTGTSQVPTYFISHVAAQTATPPLCTQEGGAGFFIDVSYWVADAAGNQITQSGMAPGENLGNGTGWHDAYATPPTTRSDGSFDDTPFGTCYVTSGHHCEAGYPQSFRLTNNGQVFPIMTNTTSRTCTDGIQLVIQGNPTGLNRTYTFGNTQ